MNDQRFAGPHTEPTKYIGDLVMRTTPPPSLDSILQGCLQRAYHLVHFSKSSETGAGEMDAGVSDASGEKPYRSLRFKTISTWAEARRLSSWQLRLS